LQKSKIWLEASPEFSKVYAPSGKIANPGDIIKRPTLGVTLRTIAKEGPNVFYEVCFNKNYEYFRLCNRIE
jgi:gamma-glutamyltranspeptidase/glutathione hydrolase/leukotriene-C4 hydrolase